MISFNIRFRFLPYLQFWFLPSRCQLIVSSLKLNVSVKTIQSNKSVGFVLGGKCAESKQFLNTSKFKRLFLQNYKKYFLFKVSIKFSSVTVELWIDKIIVFVICLRFLMIRKSQRTAFVLFCSEIPSHFFQ